MKSFIQGKLKKICLNEPIHYKAIRDAVDDGLLIVLIGISGSGKSALAKRMATTYRIPKIRTYTTQPQSRWEPGKYHFLSPEDFADRKNKGKLTLLKKVTIPAKEDLVYLSKYHMYGTDSSVRDGAGGIIILDWEGYIDLLSFRQHDVVAFILSADVGKAYRRKLAESYAIDDFSQMFDNLLEANNGLFDKDLIDRLVKDFRIYEIDAESNPDVVFQTVDTILKGL